MAKEVSCRCLFSILEAIEYKNIPETTWLKGIPYSAEHLHNKNERVEWAVFCQVIDNVRPSFSEEDFINMGRSWINSRVIRATRLIPHILFERGELLHLAQRHIEKSGSQYFTCIDYQTTSLGPNGIRQTLKVKTGYENCREFYLITKGALEVFFILLDRDTTSINMTWLDHGAVYEIICAGGGGFFSQIRKFITQPFKAREIAIELEEVNTTLLSRYQELERAQQILQQQTTQLGTAFEINQAIRRDLDLDLVLDSIAHSIIEVAGFSAIKININSLSEEKKIKKSVNLGKIPIETEPLIESLTIENRKIGEIKFWPSAKLSISDAIALLKQVIPAILTAIHDSITYNSLLELRNNLEKKVDERTAELKKTRDALESTVELLKNAQNARDRFFANISHEFRTPLTLIEGPVKQLLNGPFSGDLKEQYSLILRNTQRLLNLVNQLLDLSKLDAGRMELKVACIDLVPMLKRITMTFASKAVQKGIRLDFKSIKKKIPLYLDKEKFETIISNLLSNAFKFTPKGERIEVSIAPVVAPVNTPDDKEKSREFVNIKIMNSGSYIPEEHIGKIFDRFYQVDEHKYSDHEGTGIGLALSKELVELHKGRIEVNCQPGTGTIFTIAFPKGRKHLADKQIIKTAEAGPEKVPISGVPDSKTINRNILLAQKDKPLLLIIEDNVDVRQFIRSGMDEGFQFLEAENGLEGFEIAVAEIPDLIISDVMMPEMDGYEFCARIKQDERTSHIPLILLTARAAAEDKMYGLERGADDYIAKPFQSEELLVRVNNIIEQRNRLRERFIKEFHIRPEEIALSSVDEQFLNRVMEIIEERMSDPQFDVDEFVANIHLSRSLLYRKIKALTGQSVKHFIRSIRLKRAVLILQKGAASITETAYKVGFKNPAYFAECFQKQFDVLPSQFVRRNKKTY